jgi:hypothetical protein
MKWNKTKGNWINNSITGEVWNPQSIFGREFRYSGIWWCVVWWFTTFRKNKVFWTRQERLAHRNSVVAQNTRSCFLIITKYFERSVSDVNTVFCRLQLLAVIFVLGENICPTVRLALLSYTQDLLKPTQSDLDSVFQWRSFSCFIILKKHLKSNAKPGSVINTKCQMRHKSVLFNVRVLDTNTWMTNDIPQSMAGNYVLSYRV